MTADEILAEFRDAGALLDGHFILSSGLRSPRYLQCARVLMDPRRAERLARALVGAARRYRRDRRRSPPRWAASSSATNSRARSAWRRCSSSARRGCSSCRRGFALEPGQPVILCEDVVTTGLSVRAKRSRRSMREGGRVVAAACLVDRSNGDGRRRRAADRAAAAAMFLAYSADALPPELAAMSGGEAGEPGLVTSRERLLRSPAALIRAAVARARRCASRCRPA